MNYLPIAASFVLILSTRLSCCMEEQIAVPPAPEYSGLTKKQLKKIGASQDHKFGRLPDKDKLEIQLEAAQAIRSGNIERVKSALYDISLVATLDLSPENQEWLEKIITRLEEKQIALMGPLAEDEALKRELQAASDAAYTELQPDQVKDAEAIKRIALAWRTQHRAHTDQAAQYRVQATTQAVAVKKAQDAVAEEKARLEQLERKATAELEKQAALERQVTHEETEAQKLQELADHFNSQSNLNLTTIASAQDGYCIIQ